MENSLDFKDKDSDADSNWRMGLTSVTSFDTQVSKVGYQQENLQILNKIEIPQQGMIIPATLHEKLAYYRAYVSSPNKSHINSVKHIKFNTFLWYYVVNMFCKSLPSTYVYVFLGIYAPEDHFFIPKMVPICYGFVWSNILASFMALSMHNRGTFLLWDYVYHGLLYKNPWNTCMENVSLVGNINVTCYNIMEFKKIILNKTLVFNTTISGYSIQSDPEIFQVAPFFFYNRRSRGTANIFAYNGMLMFIAAVLYRQIFKRYMWKVLLFTHWALNVMTLATFVHLATYYFAKGFSKLNVANNDLVQQIWGADLHSLAESMTAPPSVHILTARGLEKVKPSSHSTIIIASNAIYFIFVGFHSYMMKKYCESVTAAPLTVTIWTVQSFYCLWTIYFSFFYLGDIFTIIFFLLQALTELIVLTITFSCLVEAIGNEWRWMRRSFIAFGLAVASFVFNYLNHYYRYYVLRGSLHIFSTVAATLVETVAIYLMYPLGRLVDDITFYSGTPPTRLRIFNLRIVPVFYAVKLRILIEDMFEFIELRRSRIKERYYRLIYIQLIPFVLGLLYAIYKIVYRNKQEWKQLFKPVPEWGPKDCKELHLRKLYDSRQYIGSQAPRELSRYFIEKTELKTHKLDIQYESFSRSSIFSEVRYEEEKKSV